LGPLSKPSKRGKCTLRWLYVYWIIYTMMLMSVSLSAECLLIYIASVCADDVHVVEGASANEPGTDSTMPTQNTAVEYVRRTHRRQSSLSSFRNHSLLPANHGL